MSTVYDMYHESLPNIRKALEVIKDDLTLLDDKDACLALGEMNIAALKITLKYRLKKMRADEEINHTNVYIIVEDDNEKCKDKITALKAIRFVLDCGLARAKEVLDGNPTGRISLEDATAKLLGLRLTSTGYMLERIIEGKC